MATSLHTEAPPLQALEQALQTTPAEASRTGLVHHSDRGSNNVSLAHSDALITAGVQASVGSVRDSYDNALAETVNGLCKTELIHRRRTWPSATAVKIATLDWVTWWNTKRLHEALNFRAPAEVEASYTHPTTTAPATV